MNSQPIATARDADLRLSLAALERAAQRARDLAAQTGTAIVISQQGVVQIIRPMARAEPTQAVQEPPATYEGEP
jgi:hypothetical protein